MTSLQRLVRALRRAQRRRRAVSQRALHRRGAADVVVGLVPDVHDRARSARRRLTSRSGSLFEVGERRVRRGRGSHARRLRGRGRPGRCPGRSGPAPTLVQDAGVGHDAGRRHALELHAPGHAERRRAEPALRAVEEVRRRSGYFGSRVLDRGLGGEQPVGRDRACRRAACSGCWGRAGRRRRRCRGRTSTPTAAGSRPASASRGR